MLYAFVSVEINVRGISLHLLEDFQSAQGRVLGVEACLQRDATRSDTYGAQHIVTTTVVQAPIWRHKIFFFNNLPFT